MHGRKIDEAAFEEFKQVIGKRFVTLALNTDSFNLKGEDEFVLKAHNEAVGRYLEIFLDMSFKQVKLKRI